MTDEQVLYAVHRGYHPRMAPTASPDSRKAVKRILVECGTPDGAASYLAWVHESEDVYARQLRGVESWPGGDLTARLDLESLARHIAPRLAQAEAWEARGRTAPVRAPRPDTPDEREAKLEAAYDAMQAEIDARDERDRLAAIERMRPRNLHLVAAK